MPVKEIKTPDDLESIARLQSLGLKNMNLTVPGGIDYDKVTNARKYGIKNNINSFKSFEEEINS
jgi:uncharacterized protein YlaN (UPF0358 family)